MFKRREKKVDMPEQKKPEPRKFTFPKESLPKLWELVDAHEAGKTEVNRYNMWQFIISLFPEVDEGQWYLNRKNITKPYVKEVID